MAFDWSKYLARYQQQRGGWFFGTGDGAYDGQLILTQGDKPPVIVWFAPESQGRFITWNLCVRTAVQLEGKYELHIRPRSILGSGANGIMGLVGIENDYGAPDALRGRIVTTDNAGFTKRVLSDRELRAGLQDRGRDYLRIRPMPQADGWHLVEVGVTGMEGGNTAWWCEAMRFDTTYVTPEEKEIVYQAISEHFNSQMDQLLEFLRSCVRAVTTWRM